MRLLLLGFPTLQTSDGHPIEFDTRKALALLAYLALHDHPFQRDTLVQRDTLAALFWPELDQSRARAALRRTLAPLTKAIGHDALLATRDTLALNPDFHLWVDARAFESAANASAEIETLQKAAALYKGDFMAGFTLRDAPAFDEWQFFEADRLRRLYATTLERLILRAWLALDPLHEPAHRALMRLYAQTNQRAAALRQYRECVRILDEELGVTPLEDTRQFYEDILENRLIGGPVTDIPSSHLPIPKQVPTSHFPLTTPPTLILTPSFPLAGRTTELTALLTAYTRPSPDGFFVGLEGEAGIGKTRLAEELIAQVQARGALTLTARCYRGEEQLAYAPFLAGIRSALGHPGASTRLAHLPAPSLAEAARLLPEISPTLPSLPSSQTRLFESLRQIILELLTGPQTGLFFLDDLQWADTASLDLLAYIVHRLQDYPLFFVATWRNEGDLSRLTPLLAETERAGLGTKMTLARLTQADVTRLAVQMSLTPERLETLCTETEGLPYFVVEYLNAARQGNDWSHLTSVQDLLRARFIGLDEIARQVLATASIIGRSFDFDTLREVSGRSEEETVTGIETLLTRGLLIESTQKDEHPTSNLPRSTFTPSYDFTHEKIRTVVYEDTSFARRRLLHRRVAETLVAHARETDEPAARIAYHYQRAGQDAESARWYHRAGDYARKLYANSEGLSHYQTALALGHPEPCALHEAIGDLLTLQGDYRDAVASYETAAALSQPDSLAPIELKLANLHHRRGDFDLATNFFQFALESAHPNETIRAQIFADWSRTCARLNDHARAGQLAETALTLSRQGNDLIPAGQAHNVLGMLARQAGDLTRAADHLQQALDIAETENHLPAQIAALNNLALVSEEQQDYPRAVELAQKALDLCARLGDRHREAALRNRLADLFHASHHPSAAMHHLKKAVEIFAEIGGEAGENEPEIWKLTEW